MNIRTPLFQKFFISVRKDNPLKGYKFLEAFVSDVIREEIRGTTTNNKFIVRNYPKEEINFELVYQQLEKLIDLKQSFLRNFEKFGPHFEELDRLLRKCCTISPTDLEVKYDDSYLQGGAYLPFSVRRSSFAGSYYAAITNRFNVMSRNLNIAKKVVLKILDIFVKVSEWFSCLEELKVSINNLIDFELLKELVGDLKTFLDIYNLKTNTKIQIFKVGLKEVLEKFVKKMKNRGKLMIGGEITPVIITFFCVIFLMHDESSMLIEFIIKTEHLKWSPSGMLGIDIVVLQNLCKLLSEDFDPPTRVLVQNCPVKCSLMELLKAEVSLKDAVKNSWGYFSNLIENLAEQLEESFLILEAIYDMVKYSFSRRPLTSIIVHSAPQNTKEEDIMMALKPYLPEEAWGSINCNKSPHNKNSWSVYVSLCHSELLLQQSSISIKQKSCSVVQ